VESEVDLDRTHLVADAVRRWFAIIVAAAIVFGGLGAYFESHRAVHYTSTARVVLQPAVGNPFAPSTSSTQQVTIAMQTEAGSVSSPAVTKLVNSELHTSLQAASSEVTATVPDNTQVIAINVTASSPTTAQRLASSFATNFLRYRKAQAQASQSHQLSVLSKQLKSAQSSLTAAARSAKDKHPSADAAAEVQVNTNRVASIQESIGELQSAAILVGSVVAPASLPTSPTGLPAWVVVAAAVICGLLLGLLVALWCERRDRRVRLSGATTVNGIPVLTDLTVRRGRHRVSESAEERALTGCVALTALTQSPAVVAFAAPTTNTSSVHSVVAAIGRGLAASGYRVTIVDTSQAPNSSLDMNDVADDVEDLDELLLVGSSPKERSDNSCLRVLRSSAGSATSHDLLRGPGLTSLLQRLNRDSDYVLFICAPLSTATGSAVVRTADTLVLCVVDRVTAQQQIEAAVDRAQQLGVSTFGCVGVGPADTFLSPVTASSERTDSPEEAAEDQTNTPDDSPSRTEGIEADAVGVIRPL